MSTDTTNGSSGKFAPPNGWQAELAIWAVRHGPFFVLLLIACWAFATVFWPAYREDAKCMATAVREFSGSTKEFTGELRELREDLQDVGDEMRTTNQAVLRTLERAGYVSRRHNMEEDEAR